MSRRKKLGVFLCLLTAPFMMPNAGENTALVFIAGGDPGSLLPHAYSYGLPEDARDVYKLRIPVVNDAVAGVFHDTELTVSAPEKIVQSAAANRAFRTLIECMAAREIVLAELKTGLPFTYAGDGDPDVWQYQSEHGTVIGGAECQHPRHYAMPVLRLRVKLR